MMQPLDDVQLSTEYRSDSSPHFKPYIVNPETTSDMVERLLYRRYGCHCVPKYSSIEVMFGLEFWIINFYTCLNEVECGIMGFVRHPFLPLSYVSSDKLGAFN